MENTSQYQVPQGAPQEPRPELLLTLKPLARQRAEALRTLLRVYKELPLETAEAVSPWWRKQLGFTLAQRDAAAEFLVEAGLAAFAIGLSGRPGFRGVALRSLEIDGRISERAS